MSQPERKFGEPEGATGGTASGIDQATRPRKLTEKGLAYQLESKGKRRDYAYRQVQKHTECIKAAIQHDVTQHEMKTLHGQWMNTYENYMLCCEEYKHLLTDEQQTIDHAQYISPNLQTITELKELVVNWFRAVGSSPFTPRRFTGSHRSKSSKSSSRKSSTLSISSAKLREEQHRVELEVKAENLERKRLTEQKQIDLQRQIEEVKLKLKHEREEQELREQIAISKAKSTVLDKYDNELSGSELSVDLTHPYGYDKLSTPVEITPKPVMKEFVQWNTAKQEHYIDQPSHVSHSQDNTHVSTVSDSVKISVRNTPNPSVTERIGSDVICPQWSRESVQNPLHRSRTYYQSQPEQSGPSVQDVSTPAPDQHDAHALKHDYNTHSHTSLGKSEHDHQHVKSVSFKQDVTDSVSGALVRHMRKPPTEIKKFSGDPLEYRRFMRQFNAKVVANCDDDDEKITYLEQYTVGDPHKIVEGLSYLDGTVAYPAAINELERRYGDSQVIIDTFMQKGETWPKIAAKDHRALDDFYIYLMECLHAAKALEAMNSLDFVKNIQMLIRKLPDYLQAKWASETIKVEKRGERVVFSMLVDFVKDRSDEINNVRWGYKALGTYQKIQSDNKTPNKNKQLFATNTKQVKFQSPPHEQEHHVRAVTGDKNNALSTASGHTYTNTASKPAFAKPCIYCANQYHTLDTCDNITKLQYSDRVNFLKHNGLCFGCLRSGHQWKDCKYKAKCHACHRRHPTIMHDDNFPSYTPQPVNARRHESTEEKVVVATGQTSNHMGAGNVDYKMAIVPVRIRKENSLKEVETYAFLDPGSNVTFCTEKLMHQLEQSGKRVHIKMNTMGTPQKIHSHLLNGLEICDLRSENVIKLPNVYTKDKIPVSHNHIPTQQDVSKWSHFEDVTLPQIDGDIGLLIGNNVPDVYAPQQVKTGPQGSPFAIKTKIGWVAWSVVNNIGSVNMNVNRAQVVAIQEHEALQKLTKMYEKAVNMDFPERTIDDHAEYSQEDRQFLKNLQIRKTDDNHYEINLPFRTQPQLPNNKYTAMKRLNSLKHKLRKNSRFKQHYHEFMDLIISRGYAELAPDEDTPGTTWYLPHHGVYHPHKPDKIRVVFDCSATTQGVSLNTTLLQGPNLTNSITSVLTKFRQDEIALMADIESMFYQVKVPQEERDSLRFYWWPEGDLNKDPVPYRMTVHIFGAVSSPTCANIALRQVAHDNEKYSEVVRNSIMNNFYVDDLLKSVSSETEAKLFVHNLRALCKEGGFKLTKWITNSRAVLESIPITERAKEVKELDLEHEDLPVERALGVCWHVETDTLGFRNRIRSAPPTRRNILSIVSSVFDPLGLVSPFVLPAKILLQDLCKRQIEWDQELTGKDLDKWNSWLLDLPKLEQMMVPRSYKPHGFGEITKCQIHHFCDASDEGYGVTTYMRLVNGKGQIHCILLMSKSRVAPLKKCTTPRMELTAATLAVRLHRRLIEELEMNITHTIFWTDSMTVIRYISNQKTRFHTFVANRLQVIHEGSSVNQWRYINTASNPADCVSRGFSADKLLQSPWWVNGPNFLWEPDSEWPQNPDGVSSLPEEDPEVKRLVNVSTVKEDSLLDDSILVNELIGHYSCLKRLKRVTAWILLFIEKCRSQSMGKHIIHQRAIGCASVNLVLPDRLILKAEKLLYGYEQRRHFPDEIKALHHVSDGQSVHLKKQSQIYKLNPIMYDGLLRVGGRLSHAEMEFDAKHSIILPRNSPLSRLILEETHRSVGHLGRNTVLAKLRQKFWIIGANQTLRKLLARCVICRKYQGRCGVQQMADLPADRVHSNDPPFTAVGVDYFGPIDVRRGRAKVKRYGVLFTCLNTRAIHLEVAYSLNTDSCINAVKRFVARRGPVKIMRSDNGTNLVGAEKEMREEINKWNKTKIGENLQQQNITWEFNPPLGSHFGGVWERLIRSVRKIMYSILQEKMLHQLDDELLQTIFCEVETIMNSRPLTTVSSDVNDLDVLTPNHLLMMKAGSSQPCGVFDESDSYVRRRWRKMQHLANIFWSRWSKEYLPTLQARQKWHEIKRNIMEGDIVQLVDSTPRGAWALGRVVETIKDKKGLVRSVRVKTKTNILLRPIDKLCLILEV